MENSDLLIEDKVNTVFKNVTSEEQFRKFANACTVKAKNMKVSYGEAHKPLFKRYVRALRMQHTCAMEKLGLA